MKTSLKIAILADALDRQYAGIHMYTLALAQALCKLAHPHEIILVRPEAKGNVAGATELVVPILPVPGHQSLRMFAQIPYLIRKAKVDVVLEPAHFGPFNLPKSIKRMTTIHDLTPFLFPEMHTLHGQLLQKIFLKGILRRADHILVNSLHTQQDLTDFFPFTASKNTPILLGKDDIFKPSYDPAILRRYNIRQPYILFTGTIEPRKNLQSLLKAFELFKSQHNNPHQLVWVGKSGWKNADIFQQMERSPYRSDIIQTGYVAREELPALYSQAEAFVYPSLYEGFGLPVLEAMACGAAVITTNISSLPEVGGEAALYISPTDHAHLARHLSRLASDDAFRKQKQAQSIEQASHFSWEKTARETLRVIEGLFGK